MMLAGAVPRRAFQLKPGAAADGFLNANVASGMECAHGGG